MPVRERATPAPLLPPALDGLPWVRLITGLAALAMFAIPAGHRGPEWSTRPIADRVITAQALPPLQPPIVPSHEAGDAPLRAAAPATQVAGSTAPDRSTALHATQRLELRAKAAPRRFRRFVVMRHRAGAYTHVARARRGLTRAQVVREYLAARDEVAALTSQDSGSAYLMRLRARGGGR